MKHLLVSTLVCVAQNLIAQEDDQDYANDGACDMADDGCVSECDDFRQRKGMKRRLHTVCEWSSSSRDKMLKHLMHERA